MTLPHLDRPICEPVDLAPGAPVRAVRVRQGGAAAPTQPFVHFHDVHELVLFGRVAGRFDSADRRYVLEPHSLAYIPSMHQHDFLLQGGARDWFLVQVEAHAGVSLALQPGLEHLRRPFCARPDRTLYRRLAQLAEWLCELDPVDPLALPLVETLLRGAAGATDVDGEPRPDDAMALDRLRPAIEHLRRNPADAPGMRRAAALCALSPAYFSRRFKQQVGMSWSDYVRTHRLHLASRRLLESGQPVAAIAEELGFATPSHFSENFRRRFGLSPRAYRNMGRAGPG